VATCDAADLADDLGYDAVRLRLIGIGEAVKAFPADALVNEPRIPWRDCAARRDRLAHRCFDTSHSIVSTTVAHDLPELEAASPRLGIGRDRVNTT